MIKADTNSEWDSCDFVLLHLTPDYISMLRERVSLAIRLAETADLYYLTFSDGPKGWYKYPIDNSCQESTDEDETDAWKELPDNQEWAFIDLQDHSELTSVNRPQQKLNILQMNVFTNGDIRFIAFGEHSDERFWTARFSLDEFPLL